MEYWIFMNIILQYEYLASVNTSLYCHWGNIIFFYVYCAGRLNSFSFQTYFPSSQSCFTSPSQLFPPRHAMSSQVWTKPRSYWNGVSHATWAAAKTSSTTSSARSASPSGGCARGATTTSTFRRATSDWPSVASLCATCKRTRSTALRFRRSMAFQTRARTRRSSRQWTSPQTKQVSAAAAAASCWASELNFQALPTFKHWEKIQKKVRWCVLCVKKWGSIFCMHVGVCYIFSLWIGDRERRRSSEWA